MVVGTHEWWWAFLIGWALAEADGGHSWLVTDRGSRASLPYLQGGVGPSSPFIEGRSGLSSSFVDGGAGS